MTTPPTCIFPPGIIAPAVVRYAALIRELGQSTRAYTKELEVYTLSPAPASYAIADEIQGLLEGSRRAELDRFHLTGTLGAALSRSPSRPRTRS